MVGCPKDSFGEWMSNNSKRLSICIYMAISGIITYNHTIIHSYTPATEVRNIKK